MKTCPYCAEQILDDAVTCRRCGELLDPSAATTTELPIAPAGGGSYSPVYPPAPLPASAPQYATPSPYASAPLPPTAAAPPGPGWWMAADGRWYPPQAPPVYAPTPGWAQAPDGQWYPAAVQPMAVYPVYGYGPPKTKAAAALLAFFIGSTGAHNFYLGRTSTAVTQLCLLIGGILTSWLIIGLFVLMGLSIWVFIEFILILTGGIRDGQNRPLF